jgi:hypothetical protein
MIKESPDRVSRNAKIVEMLNSGSRPIDIKNSIPGVSGCNVSYWRAKLGIQKFLPGNKLGYRFNPETSAEVLRLKQSGMTYREIGERFGHSKQWAQQMIIAQRRSPIESDATCAACGAGTDAKLHRHHHSYCSGDVIFLCASCHSAETSRLSQVTRDRCGRYASNIKEEYSIDRSPQSIGRL